MPQIPVNSANIINFGFAASFNIQGRSVLFVASLTTYNSGGINNVAGICFSMLDSVGMELMGVDWNNPQIIPRTAQTYTLDLTALPINFLFQNYQITGFIKDANGTIYQTAPVLKTICQPPQICDTGYVPGSFQILPDCINNVLTVKEFTLLTYNSQLPINVTKSGTLYYPTGTISPLTFTNTPFSNNIVYTGQYAINCTTIATYDLSDNIFVLVSYLTQQQFPVNCTNFIGDITCCLTEVYNTYLNNCDNAVGKYALQQYNSTMLPFSLALAKQINGQDASNEIAQIKKMLNCNCGSTSVGQNQITPVNPSVNSIVLTGVGGTNIPSPTIIGNTKTYSIASSSYVVSKGNTGDLAYSIAVDTSVSNVVTYKITFNYDTMAGYILTAIAADPTLLNQLNTLITASGGSIAGLNGQCVIDLTKSNYSVSQAVTGSTLISNVVIGGVIYLAPTNLFANNPTPIAAWLNGLTLGAFTAVVNTGILTIQSVANTNIISTISFTSPSVTSVFSATNATLVQVLQAVINYLCNITALQVALANNMNLCTFDYNGNVVTTTIAGTAKQNDYNAAIASAICNIVSRINTLTSVTCDTLKAIFIDRPTVPFGPTDRIYGTLGGNCSSLSDQQIANMVIAAVGKYGDVKAAWCAINCSSVGTCPDITNTNLAMSGANIGVYGLTWSFAQSASQTVTVKYRVTGTLTYFVATSNLLILPNGNLSGSSPFLISGLTAGTSYDVLIQNNCGGTGFTKQILTPTGSVYSGNYLLDNVLYNICGDSSVVLYSSQPFGIGTIMYTNIGLTIPVTGYGYITIAGSNIFTINNTTGQVLADTGSSCSNGTSGSYQLSNSTSTICSASPVTLYTNGAFAVGQVVYTDAALTTPQTGYSYISFNSVIYTINSSTGAVTGTTGLSCINYTLSAAYNFSISSVTGTGVPTLPATSVNGSQTGHHTAMSGSYAVVLSGTIVVTTKLVAYVNNVVVACVAVPSAGSYALAITAAETDVVLISVDSGVC